MSASEQATTLRIRVNGEQRLVAPGTKVTALLNTQEADCAAVARNREVVPRGEWQRTALADGDEIEIVRPVGGGAR